MRFAIALLTVICIASVIGTVIEQRQPQIIGRWNRRAGGLGDRAFASIVVDPYLSNPIARASATIWRSGAIPM